MAAGVGVVLQVGVRAGRNMPKSDLLVGLSFSHGRQR